jgi:hypothetical protein
LPWGPANEIQVMERNMLPKAGFGGASQNIAEPADNANAAKIMGDYYPTSAYCSEATFEQGGWQACLPALAKALDKTRHKAPAKKRAKKPTKKHATKPTKKPAK